MVALCHVSLENMCGVTIEGHINPGKKKTLFPTTRTKTVSVVD